MSLFKNIMTQAMRKIVPLLPDRAVPGGTPDPLIDAPLKIIGTPVARVDGPRKVRGAAPFAAEHTFAEMLYASLVYSTIPRGRIHWIDTSVAEAAPGVRLVMTHRNAPPMKSVPYFMKDERSSASDDVAVMQDDRVHWDGQAVAVVLADTHEQAEHAAAMVLVEYEQDRAARTSIADDPAPSVGRFQDEKLESSTGDAEDALAAALHRVDNVYRTPRYNHNAIELHAVTVAWRDDQLYVRDASQGVVHAAWCLSQIFDIPQEHVHVTSPFVGGGFGGKTLWPHHALAAAASRQAGRPVRLVLSREGVYRGVGGRTCTEQRVALGADATGTLSAIIHTGTVAATAHNNVPEPFINGTQVIYGAPNTLLRVDAAQLDMVPNTFMRAPGEAVGTFALESAIDELAAAMETDPIELRVRNEPSRDPTSGLPFSERSLVEAYRRGAERFDWSQRASTPGTRVEGEWKIGMGCATGTYPYYRMPGGEARISLTRGDGAVVEAAAHEMGMGTETTQRMIAAERLGLPLSEVRFSYGDSGLRGLILAGGSQQTAAVSAAVRVAYEALVDELLRLCGAESPLHGAEAADVVSRDRGLALRSDPARHETYDQILARAGKDSITVDGTAPQPMEIMHWSMHSYSALFCEVGVSVVTGEVRVRRFLGSFDCGRIINPQTAASQFRGGIIMGLGLALMEETKFDERRGRIANPSLAEYHVPVHMDVPAIEVMWNDIPDPHTPLGARGVGEIGITGTAAAVANAVYNATGRRIRELPITLDKLL